MQILNLVCNALVEKLDCMLQRQIVIKALGTRIGIEDLVCIKYAGTSFHFLDCILISVNVTIYRTVPMQAYQGTNYCMMMNMTKLMSCI
jgi:hypothetical protein